MKLIKICGIKRYEAAVEAIAYGTDLLGMIMVPNRSRTIDLQEAKRITQYVKDVRHQREVQYSTIKDILNAVAQQEFDSIDECFDKIKTLIQENGPFVVGVFRNQPIAEVFKLADEVGLDIIQLHGNENKMEYCKYNESQGLNYGIIARYVIPNEIDIIYSSFEEIYIGGRYFGSGFLLPLLDSEVGGEGKVIDWSLLDDLSIGKYILAGGLTEENVVDLKRYTNLLGLDVSGGVETNGEKDSGKMKAFISNGKSV